MKYLFRGGTVVSGRGTRRADILVEGEKILEVGRNITRKADQIIDVTGMLLMPGFIDAHTHFDLDVCNTTTADNFTTGSRAACGAAPPWWTSPAPTRGEPAPRAGLAPEGRRPHLLRLRLPHDHRRLEPADRGGDRRYVRRRNLLLQDVYDLSRHDDRGQRHVPRPEKAEGERAASAAYTVKNSGVIDALIEKKKAAGEMGVSSPGPVRTFWRRRP